jgi:hypothetical protein
MVDPLTYELRGPAGVRAVVCDFLRGNLPLFAQACRDAWDVPDEELPVPVSDPRDPKRDAYFAREPAAIDRWPMIAVTSGRRTQRETDRDGSGGIVFRATYATRVYWWVKDAGWDATVEQRDNLGTAIQVALLSRLSMGSVGARLQIVPSTLIFDPSVIAKVQGDRYVAGGFIGFDINATETLTDRLALPGEQPRDTVAAVSATGAVLPPHPALL